MTLDDEQIKDFSVICDALSDDDDRLKRELLSHAGNRWSTGVIYTLGTKGTLRHAELARALPGVTQRMLTRTLRQLERDGLITRHDHQRKTPHPRVNYTLTGLGKEMLLAMLPLWNWIISNSAAFRASRKAHEQRHGAA
ncbi:helix-turn-helix domain-containing protein [Siccibacter colletis]|uniref:winged helix-turn-helix transcriptional regulator n=1 Tax=Siccibacter colletis TaxID=1505757 RepID=UPI0028BEB16A|nr:helix-turn-helix domain-containing protein [Siccibacter colletis]WNN47569.1 helix-turn-helix domain-containing protein [Siccibacter colletis]